MSDTRNVESIESVVAYSITQLVPRFHLPRRQPEFSPGRSPGR